MTPSGNADGTVFIKGRAHIVIAFGNQGKGGENIQMGQCRRRSLEGSDPVGTGLADTAEGVVFQGVQLVFRVEDTVLEFLETLGGISLGTHQGLFADIIVRNQIFEGIGDFKIVAEDFVVLDAEIFDAGALPVLSLQIHQPFFAVVAGIAQMVDIRVKSGLDDIAFPDGDRGLIDDRTLQETGELGKILDFFAIAGKRTRFRAFFCRILSGGSFSRGGKLSDVGKKTGF